MRQCKEFHAFWFVDDNATKFVCARNTFHEWLEPSYRIGKEVFRYCPECGHYSESKDVNDNVS